MYQSTTGISCFMIEDTPGLTITEYVPPAPIQFEGGDVLGVYQASGFIYSRRLSMIHVDVPSGFGHVNYLYVGGTDEEVFDTMASGVSASSDFPLVAVNTSKHHSWWAL